MTTISRLGENGSVQPIKSYEHAQKLHELSDHIAVATWGTGNLGTRSVRSFIAEYARELQLKGVEQKVRDAAAGLLEFLNTAYKECWPEHGPAMGVMVCGYSPGNELPETWEFNPEILDLKPLRGSSDSGMFGASWRGVGNPFTRLYVGVDPKLHAELLSLLGKETLAKLISKVKIPFVLDGMPIQEAVDFVTFILQTTVNTAKFSPGVQSCGGPLWVATITKDSGFSWVQRPELRVRGV